MENSLQIGNPSRPIDYLLYIYFLALALFEVTPNYYFVNYLSIIACLICIPFIPDIHSIRYSKPIWFYTLQLIWLFIALFFIEHMENSAYGLASLSKNVITAIIPAVFINSKVKLVNCLWAFVIGGSCNVILNVVSGLSSISSGRRYFSEELQLSLNTYAHGVLVFVLAGILLYTLIDSKFKKNYLIAFFIVSFLSLMITGSRQSFVALFAFFVFSAYLNLKTLSTKNIVLLMLGVFLFGVILSFVFETYSSSAIVQRFTEGNEEGDGDRVMLFKKGVHLFLDSPIFGYGLDTFRYFSNYVYTHSTYSDLLFSGGFFYALFFVLFYVFIFKRFKKIEQQYILDTKTIRAINVIKCIIFAILVNGVFYLILNSRLALTLQFIIINYILTLRRNSVGHGKYYHYGVAN